MIAFVIRHSSFKHLLLRRFSSRCRLQSMLYGMIVAGDNLPTNSTR